MSNERKEPTLSSSTPLSDTSRPPSARNESGDSARPRSRPAAKSPAASKPAVNAQTRPQNKAKSNLGVVIVVLFISLGALGVAAYNTWQLQLATATITNQQGRIVELENKLTLSDDESSQSITSLASNFISMNSDLKLSLNEIDKLWATRNVNRTAITENTEKLEAIEKQTVSLNTAISAADKAIETLNQSNKALSTATETQLNALDSELKTLSASQSEQLAATKQQIEALTEKNNTTNSLATSVKKQLTEQELILQSLREQNQNSTGTGADTSARLQRLAEQVAENEEAVKSIDAFRLTVNRELLLLKQRTSQ